MDEKTGVLEEYLKKGLEKGFNVGYIKETLIRHGHDSESVETAANNVKGLKVPEQLKDHVEEEPVRKSKTPIILYALIIILLLITSFFVVNYFINKSKVEEVKSELEEVQELGIDIDDLSDAIKTQSDLIKQKDLTIDEKEKIIEDQIKLIDEINDKIETQRTKLKEILLDIMNRMIGRMSE